MPSLLLPAEVNLTFGCPGIVGTRSVVGTVVLGRSPEPAACLPVIDRERVTLTSVTSAGGPRLQRVFGMPEGLITLTGLTDPDEDVPDGEPGRAARPPVGTGRAGTGT
ncbi:hypothetical protein [Streptomyces goshikiensis]|uniref:hypothetical protein n=1 Tax=Streptomyces goshikiensis TaxID=1942 RepID=UPI003719B098